MQNDTIQNLSEYIATQILKQPGSHIDPNDALISSGLVDSFHLVDLSLYVEDTFGVRLDDTELNAETFDTLVELAELINQRAV